ncbi:MAG: hypothetical protein E7430_06555 [Ruminococcaceae bacterium]|nr:hypothetical protein [Oscillospiraceae bacterium]
MCCDRRSEKFFMGMAVGMVAGATLCCCLEKFCHKKKGHCHKPMKDKMIRTVENCAENIGDHLGM